MKDRGGTRALMKVCRRSRGSDILFCVQEGGNENKWLFDTLV